MRNKIKKRYRKNSWPTKTQIKRNHPDGRVQKKHQASSMFDSLIRGLGSLKKDKED